MIAPDAQQFRDAMRAVAGSVGVITVGSGAEASGMVVTSAVSLSVDPALLLVCINRSASCHPLLLETRAFGWSCLGAAHQAVAERFSGKGGVKGAARYQGAEWEVAVTGAPLLKGAPTAFDCDLEDVIDRATHSIVLGRVRAITTTPGTGVLTYWNGRYLPLAE